MTDEVARPLSVGERGLCNGVESCQHGIAWNNGCRECTTPSIEEDIAAAERERIVRLSRDVARHMSENDVSEDVLKGWHAFAGWVRFGCRVEPDVRGSITETDPPADLPATLATVDDVEKVCEAAGMTCTRYGWVLDQLTVECDEQAWHLAAPSHLGPTRGADLDYGWPTALLWHAIQAARSTS